MRIDDQINDPYMLLHIFERFSNSLKFIYVYAGDPLTGEW